MQTWYPCFIENRPSSVTVHRQNGRAEIWGGGLRQLYFSLFSLRAVKGFMWFRVLMTRTRETETQICLGKRTVRQRNRPRDRSVPVNAFIHIFTLKKNLFTTVQRSRPTSVGQEEGTSFSIINCILLALMHTWQVRKYTVHSYIQYIHCWEYSRGLEGRQRD